MSSRCVDDFGDLRTSNFTTNNIRIRMIFLEYFIIYIFLDSLSHHRVRYNLQKFIRLLKELEVKFIHLFNNFFYFSVIFCTSYLFFKHRHIIRYIVSLIGICANLIFNQIWLFTKNAIITIFWVFRCFFFYYTLSS